MSAGYSKKSLVEKLGIKPGYKIYFMNAPENYNDTLGKLPGDIVISKRLSEKIDFIQLFVKSRRVLQQKFPKCKKALAMDGMLWISWPKKASKMGTDLKENDVREIGLKNGLVDVKVCAVDEVWSGLKFVYRLKDRG